MKNLIALAVLSFLVFGLYSCDEDEVICDNNNELSIIDNTDPGHVANTFSNIELGYYGEENKECYLLIYTAAEFADLWNKIYSNNSPIPPVPTIDFDTYGVAAAFMGEKTTGGYSIEITGVYTKNDKVYATIKKKTPSSDDIVTQAFSAPFHLVKFLKN